MFGPPSPLIENYLREASFWHVANIGGGASWTRNSSLQLRLPMEGFILTRSVQSADWGALGVCCVGNIVSGDLQGEATK
ncbi:hypothetical protein Godav_002894 [Gossypium davidsonii]|uniref:Uncharacterized protein n=1 Tax=Gossypium davidsonii TaxID=34287 RepID=A0A7J8SXJ7_GOSDV|nr:hypothetical protein [Gossypium davidsonii]